MYKNASTFFRTIILVFLELCKPLKEYYTEEEYNKALGISKAVSRSRSQIPFEVAKQRDYGIGPERIKSHNKLTLF